MNARKNQMRLVAPIIGLIFLGAYPAAVSAQVVSYPGPPSSVGVVTPAAAQEKADVGTPLRQKTSATTTSSAETPSSALTLKPHSAGGHADSGKRPGGIQSLATVGGSLAVVLGIFFLIVWVLRRASPRGLRTLPGEAFEVLGRAPLAHHQQAHLLRCGNKLLLVAVTATSAETLTEITDPAEVDRLALLCRPTKSGSPVQSFRQVFRQAEERHA
jgi:flagellar protein FliO/FliZ